MQKAVNPPRFRRAATAVAAAVSALVAVPRQSNAALYQIQSGNSTISLNPFADPSESIAGLYNWTVDGVSQARQQDYWIRVNAGGPASELASLTPIGTPLLEDLTGNNGAPNYASINYQGTGYTAKATYTLTGDLTGGNFSNLIETIVITNTGSSNLPVEAVNFNDLNLGNDSDNDSTSITNAGVSIMQTSANGWTAAGTATPTPNEYTTGAYATLLTGFNTGSAVPLADNATSSGTDGEAVEYDQTLLSNNSLIFTVVQTITGPTVPEPTSISLLGIGSLILLRPRRRANRA
ncbi:MAG: hypothetical protein ABSH22_17595 [Tepidisphaeraceae bacterium]|jgi:hypothetical protein